MCPPSILLAQSDSYVDCEISDNIFVGQGPHSLFVTCAVETMVRDHSGHPLLAIPGAKIIKNKSGSTEDYEVMRFVSFQPTLSFPFSSANFQENPTGIQCPVGLRPDESLVQHKFPNYYPLVFPYSKLWDDGFHGPVTGPLQPIPVVLEDEK